MKLRLLLFCVYMACTSMSASAQPRQMQRLDDPTGYKDTYKDYFTVGVALNIRNVASTGTAGWLCMWKRRTAPGVLPAMPTTKGR